MQSFILANENPILSKMGSTPPEIREQEKDTRDFSSGSFILLGSYKNQEDYLRSFQKEHAVPGYFVLRYLETFKIADVRALQKTLGVKLHGKEERMIVISHPTLDAQNAILKTLEELPEKTYVFFLCHTREDVLPTISSRSSLIILEQENEVIDKDIKKQIREVVFGEDNVPSLFSLIDVFGLTLEEAHMESVLLSLRKILFVEIFQKSKQALPLFRIIKTLDKNYKLTKTNNISKRMALENALLTSNF